MTDGEDERPEDRPQGPPAGWYPDPGGSGSQRWWDGSTWTEHHQTQESKSGSSLLPRGWSDRPSSFKWAFGGTAAALVSLILPWQRTFFGTTASGFDSGGWLICFFLIPALWRLYVFATRGGYRNLLAVSLFGGLSAAFTIYAVVFFIASDDSVLGDDIQSPAWGVFVSVAACVAMTVGAVLSYRAEKRSGSAAKTSEPRSFPVPRKIWIPVVAALGALLIAGIVYDATTTSSDEIEWSGDQVADELDLAPSEYIEDSYDIGGDDDCTLYDLDDSIFTSEGEIEDFYAPESVATNPEGNAGVYLTGDEDGDECFEDAERRLAELDSDTVTPEG